MLVVVYQLFQLTNLIFIARVFKTLFVKKCLNINIKKR